MALHGNRSVLHKSPGRFLSGTVASGDRNNFNKHGMMRNAFETFPDQASIPRGYYGGAGAWVQPRKGGAMSSHLTASVGVTATAHGWMGLPGAGTAAFAITTNNPAGQLIVSGRGTANISVQALPLLMTASVSGRGSANISFFTNAARLGALASMRGETGFSITGHLTPFAVGKMSGFAKLAGEGQVLEVQYQGEVYVSPFGQDGMEYPAGTATYPCRTLEGADFIASKYSLRKYNISGNYVLQHGYSNVSFSGWGPIQFCQIDVNDQVLDTVTFKDCVVTGKLNAVIVVGGGWQESLAKVDFYRCYLFEVEDLEGTARGCQVEGLTRMKAGGWFSAIETVIEGDSTIFDLRNTAGTTVSMDVSSGWSQFINAVEGCLVELNVKGGEVSFDASCGEYYLEGVGTLFNESGMAAKENHFIWDEKLDGVHSGAQLQRVMSSVLAGKTSGMGGNTPAFRDLSDTANVVSATLDAAGNRTAVTLDL